MVYPVPVYDVVSNVHQHDFTDDQSMLVDALTDGDDLVQTALHVYGGLGYPRRLHYQGVDCGQAGDLELVNFPHGAPLVPRWR